MKNACRASAVVCLLWVCLVGCGGNPTPPLQPPTNACTLITGTLKDTLTAQSVAQGVAVLESGTQQLTSSIYNFSPAKQVTTDASGSFSLCVQSIPYPSALVLEAVDSTGKAYPPYVTAISGAANLGTIPMGGCVLACGFMPGQLQTSTPATITGVITSAPVAVSGSVVPQYALQALDASKSPDGFPNIWALALPLFPASPNLVFNTTSGACPGGAPYCSTYTLTVPSQSPVMPVAGGTVQAAVAPIYLIYAASGTGTACNPTFAFSAFQTDGLTMLAATPAAQLTALTMNLTNCH